MMQVEIDDNLAEKITPLAEAQGKSVDEMVNDLCRIHIDPEFKKEKLEGQEWGMQ